jgi:hypothetical protein
MKGERRRASRIKNGWMKLRKMKGRRRRASIISNKNQNKKYIAARSDVIVIMKFNFNSYHYQAIMACIAAKI